MEDKVRSFSRYFNVFPSPWLVVCAAKDEAYPAKNRVRCSSSPSNQVDRERKGSSKCVLPMLSGLSCMALGR